MHGGSLEIEGRNYVIFSLDFLAKFLAFLWFVEEVHSNIRKEDFLRFQNTSRFVEKYSASPCIFNSSRRLEIGGSPSFSHLNYYFEGISADKMVSLQYNRIKQYFVC